MVKHEAFILINNLGSGLELYPLSSQGQLGRRAQPQSANTSAARHLKDLGHEGRHRNQCLLTLGTSPCLCLEVGCVLLVSPGK